MNQKVEELCKKGLSFEFSVALCWGLLTNDDKEELTMANCYELWDKIPTGSPEEGGIWQLIKSKMTNFEECKKVIKDVLLVFIEDDLGKVDDKFGSEALIIAANQATSKKQLKWLLQISNGDKSVEIEIIKAFAKMAENFDDCVDICDSLPLNSPTRADAWRLAILKANSREEWDWCLEFMPDDYEDAETICNSVKESIRSLEECQNIWDDITRDGVAEFSSQNYQMRRWNIVKERIQEL